MGKATMHKHVSNILPKSKVFILLFPNFEAPDIYMYEIIPEKKAQALMTDSNNLFEELISKFYIRYGKLQITGYHGKNKDPRKRSVVR